MVKMEVKLQISDSAEDSHRPSHQAKCNRLSNHCFRSRIIHRNLSELYLPLICNALLFLHPGRYKGVYSGPQQQRDEAYHQGTVWAYLMGPFVESFLKVNGFSRKSKKKAAEFIQPLLQHLTEDGCLGSVSEIFDGDMPHKPRGCIAQAWSVAELIRAYQLINS